MFLRTATVRLPAGLDVCDLAAIQELFRSAESADQAILDFSELLAVSPQLLGALITLVNRMVGHNRLGLVRIVGANPGIVRIFELCHAETLFEFVDADNAYSQHQLRTYLN
jgi:anti-anti-sigma regulatory factor